MISEMTSAMGNDHQTEWSPPMDARMYAAGTRTKSCLIIDTIILKTAFPSAWNIVPATMQNHAIR